MELHTNIQAHFNNERHLHWSHISESAQQSTLWKKTSEEGQAPVLFAVIVSQSRQWMSKANVGM